MKIANVGLIFLFSITLFEYGINADSTPIPKDIAKKIKNILEIFQNWIANNKTADNALFISYLNEFGKLIAHILSISTNHQIGWLWQLSLLSNSVDKFYKPLENLNLSENQILMERKADRIFYEIINIRQGLYYNQQIFENNEDSYFVNYLENNIESINKIPSKLKSLESKIKSKFGNCNNATVNYYTPQNLFLYDIFPEKESVKTLFTKCSFIIWKTKFEDGLFDSYHVAINKWIDHNSIYLDLFKFRRILMDAVQLSLYIHLIVHTSAYAANVECSYNMNVKKWSILWFSMVTLVNEFIKFFDLNVFEDSHNDFQLINTFLNQTKDYKIKKTFEIISTQINGIHRMATNQFTENRKEFYELQDYKLKETFTDKLKKGEYLEHIINENYLTLQTYFNNVKNLFQNVNFHVFTIFRHNTEYKQMTV